MSPVKVFSSFCIVIILLLTACQDAEISKSTSPSTSIDKIFDKMTEAESGITFSNDLKEDSIVNYFTYPYIYMGGGIAVGDVNNDGLQDLYFTGNMVDNKLYLNKGDLKFDDITDIANVGSDDRWITGVTMVDVNADGLTDIYVSVSGKWTTKKNQLFINQGNNSEGIPTFIDEAEERGVADESSTTQGTFFDYDKDGDLDLYLANYPATGFKTSNFNFANYMKDPKIEKSDHLYANDGKGNFSDVTQEAGLLNFGLSLSATVGDFNQDGWDDIYVSNDFASPDHFYFSNGDGTFTDHIQEVTQHTAFFGMGADVSDFNNDGLLDVFQMDMTPADNKRNKANMASMDIPRFWEMVNYGLHHQYMQNALQMNAGLGPNGLPHFSDVSRMTGMATTDWSWAGLLADLDNDGYKDAFITNGTRRDINNKDYFNKIEKANYQEKQAFDYLELTLNMPSEKVDNYVYKNNGGINFTDVTKDWGINHEGYTNGATYADLDNDGDLEIIINNIDAPALLYRNNTVEKNKGNFLRLKLKGPKNNTHGLGSKITITGTNGIQYHEHTLTRGFQSAVDPIIHFGVGDEANIEEVYIEWNDGSNETIKNVAPNQILEIGYENAEKRSKVKVAETDPIFKDISKESGVKYTHSENPYDDYKVEILLPHTYSKNGPALATGDVNGDGLDDFYIGGGGGSRAAFYIQKEDGTFFISQTDLWVLDANTEDIGALLFDADNDSDLDLYVTCGGNEYNEGASKLQDKFYINDGSGTFTKSTSALPTMTGSGSRVRAADYDDDGDMDLFVGGRLVPKFYPSPAKSYILKNNLTESGQLKYTDVTATIAPDLVKAGMVTDATWVDYNQDDKLDLIIVGEWMPITLLENKGNGFENKTKKYNLEKSTGWWYSIVAEDFDNDGDVDLMAGNLGLNYKYQATEEESFDVYASDYDNNGKQDIVLGYYQDGVQYPLRGKQCSSEQIPAIKYKYEEYDLFAEASLEDVYTAADLKKSMHYQAYTFASSYIENNGNGNFELHKLPDEAQLSSINGIVIEDYNNDGNADVILGGNMYGSEVETPRNDASYGLLMLGNGKGQFRPVTLAESGVYIKGDTKGLDKIKMKNGLGIIAANNSAKPTLLKMNKIE